MLKLFSIARIPSLSFASLFRYGKKGRSKRIPNQRIISLKGNFPMNNFFKQLIRYHNFDYRVIPRIMEHYAMQRFVNEEFGILPFLCDKEKIEQFFEKFYNGSEFAEEISKYFSAKAYIRPFHRTIFRKEELQNMLPYVFPFLKLYEKFIEENYPQELDFSREISKITDFREPHNWFPEARLIKRKVIYHYGPTNSGKTYEAMKSLKEAESGIYCAPLRLLAWENYEKLNSEGKLCSLITGQEKDIKENAQFIACTVECTDINEEFDVAIIDEIQMIGDYDRGFAWTNAFLGIKCRELHLCGDERAINLISSICNLTGDSFEKREYKRLSNLKVENSKINLKTGLKEGDCIIAFDTKSLHTLKKNINSVYGSNGENVCSIIYGKLPPETRIHQATSFNDPSSSVKYLVATDAVGMGLNLNIQRVIFMNLHKNIDSKKIPLDIWSIRQIAGRAGRFKSSGLVNCAYERDKKLLRSALSSSIKRHHSKFDDDEFPSSQSLIFKGGIFPVYSQVEKFIAYYKINFPKKEKLSSIIKKFISICILQENYFLSDFTDFFFLLDAIETVQLSSEDQFNFALAPVAVKKRNLFAIDCFVQFARDFKFSCFKKGNSTM